MRSYREPGRDVPVADGADVVVCGGGPAGVAAAVAAARAGASTILLEVHGALGGVWTAGALSWILDADKTGIVAEITEALDARGARAGDARGSFGYDVEQMKLLLDEITADAGVRVQLHTRVVAAPPGPDGRLRLVVSESKSGRQAWPAQVVIDATGDGDVAALAGCGFDYGHPETGQAQPMSLMALVTGVRVQDVHDYVSGGTKPAGSKPKAGGRGRAPAKLLLETLERAGCRPSYTSPTLWCIHEDLFALMANHEYGVSAFDAAQITRATTNARAEIHRIIGALKSSGWPWSGVRLVATAAQIGVREGRRIHGRYRVTIDDLRRGARHDDAICRVTAGADVHALTRAEGGFLSRATEPLQDRAIAAETIAAVRPYDIPLRALIARDVDGLLMAGRCISGDFLAHASYRVTGNAVTMGQAAGAAAAVAARSGRMPHEVPWSEVAEVLHATLPTGV